jgi:hypothetical protein
VAQTQQLNPICLEVELTIGNHRNRRKQRRKARNRTRDTWAAIVGSLFRRRVRLVRNIVEASTLPMLTAAALGLGFDDEQSFDRVVDQAIIMAEPYITALWRSRTSPRLAERLSVCCCRILPAQLPTRERCSRRVGVRWQTLSTGAGWRPTTLRLPDA